MNSPRGNAQTAVLLVISGYLGVITARVTGSPIFGVMGLAGFLFAAAIGVGVLLQQFRAGLDEPRAKKHASKRDGEYRATEDGRPVPTRTETPKSRPRATDYRNL